MPELSSNANAVVAKRYFEDSEISWEGLSRRVGEANAVNEKERVKYENLFSNEIFDMNFIPAGRILRNSGKPKQSMLNCACLPIGDSIEAIGETIKNALIMWSYGAGIGIDFSPLREKGRKLASKGGVSSGMLSFLEAIDYVAHTIETGGQRRSGLLGMLSISHPEIFDFINAKQKPGVLPYCNLSVAIPNNFIDAVNEDKEWDLLFAGQKVRTVSAVELWREILTNMMNHGEPGIIMIDNMRKNNSYYCYPISAPNLCLTGDTKIAVADGRGDVSIKDLADKKEDIPVFCTNYSGEVVIRQMRNPKITRKQAKILKVKFDDGSYFRGTEDHEIKLLDGKPIKLKDIKIGSRVSHLTRYKLANTRAKKNTPYWFWNRGSAFQKSEHRIVYEHYFGKIEDNYIIHHKDFDSLNNIPKNLEKLHKNKHVELHAKISTVGEKNGRYKGYTQSAIFDIAVNYSSQLGRRVTKEEWGQYCKLNNLPYSEYSIHPCKSVNNFLLKAAVTAQTMLNPDIYIYKNSAEAREYKRYLKLIDETDLDIFFSNSSIYVNKICEGCDKVFAVKWGKRNNSFCSTTCANRYIANSNNVKAYYKTKQIIVKEKQVNVFLKLRDVLNRTPLIKEWKNRCKEVGIPYRLHFNSFKTYADLKEAALSENFKVVSVKHDGYEDVYNGAVDEFHNYFVVVNSTDNRKKIINSMNCSELPLPAYGVCDLGSLVLPNFISGRSTNWKKLEDSIYLAVRFLDNVLDVNYFPIRQMDVVAKDIRKIGLGTMGLHDYLMLKQIRYGSDKSIEEIEKLYKFIRNVAYQASIELAVEKGAFPRFSPNEFGKASFIRKLPPKLRLEIRDKGIRNNSILCAAPVGTTSLIPEVSSGVEPVFALACRRKDRVSDRVYIHPQYLNYIESNEKKPDWLVDSSDLKPEDHLDVQSTIQMYLDNAISKTINFPESVTVDNLSKLLLEYAHNLKGLTILVDKARGDQVLNRLTKQEAKEFLKKDNFNTSEDVVDIECSTGSCDI